MFGSNGKRWGLGQQGRVKCRRVGAVAGRVTQLQHRIDRIVPAMGGACWVNKPLPLEMIYAPSSDRSQHPKGVRSLPRPANGILRVSVRRTRWGKYPRYECCRHHEFLLSKHLRQRECEERRRERTHDDGKNKVSHTSDHLLFLMAVNAFRHDFRLPKTRTHGPNGRKKNYCQG